MLPEFLGRDQPALRAHRVGELLARGSGLAADLAGRVHGVLLLDGVDDFRNRDPQLRQLVGLYPDAHRILARAEHRTRPDAGHAQSAGHSMIDVGVVGQKMRVVGAVRRIQRNSISGAERRFLHRHAVIADVGRQLRLRLVLRASAPGSGRCSDRSPRRNRRSASSRRCWR